MRLILLGPPGAGKGTQAELITKEFSIPKISTGDILRAAINAKNQLGRQVQQIMAEGKLVSDDIIIALVKERIQQSDCRNGFLLDGFPRTIPQAEALYENNIFIDYVIEISVPDDQLIKRLSGRRVHVSSGRVYHVEYHPPKISDIDDITGEPLIHRPDDYEETIRKRLEIYHQQTKPLIQYYQAEANSHINHSPTYIKIDGVGTVEEIRNKIFAALAPYTGS